MSFICLIREEEPFAVIVIPFYPAFVKCWHELATHQHLWDDRNDIFLLSLIDWFDWLIWLIDWLIVCTQVCNSFLLFEYARWPTGSLQKYVNG